MRRHIPGRVIAAVAAAVLVLAACGSTASTSGAPSTGAAAVGERSILPPISSGPPASTNGTLKIVGSGDVDYLDTCCAYYTTTYEILRALSRQLVSYPSVAGKIIGSSAPVPDLATYTITKNSTVFTFTIKSGEYWDVAGQKVPIVAADEVRGIKRLCNPVTPAPPLAYWENNIVGMRSYCQGFSALKLSTNPALEVTQLKTYIDTHNISGLTMPNSSTVVFTLMHPSNSFINIMAMPMSSPVPAATLNYLPGSVQEEKNFPSDGPYMLDSYVPKVSYRLSRNPYWSQSTDSLRHQYFAHIDVTMGESQTAVQQQLSTGTADLEWDTVVPNASIQSLVTTHSKQFLAVFIGGITYLAFNMQSTADGGALQKPAVRQALQYCVNKNHLVQVSGGSTINAPDNQILAPQITGFKKIDPYPSGNNGDPAKCKAMLAKAGYPHGITLAVTYPNNPPAPNLFAALQADFAKGGVTLTANEQPTQGAYFTYIETPANKAHWDLAYGAWFPDWEGNSAQSYFGPLLDGRLYTAGSTDYGDYNNATVNGYIDSALSQPTVAGAAADWARADSYAMTTNPPWIPLLYNALPQYVGTNVKNAIYNAFLGYVDITQIQRG